MALGCPSVVKGLAYSTYVQETPASIPAVMRKMLQPKHAQYAGYSYRNNDAVVTGHAHNAESHEQDFATTEW